MTFSTLASPGISLQGGGGSGGGGGGTPGGSNTQIQYNSSGTFAGASGLTTTTGTELTIASGTKTADAPVLDMSQTWNNAAVTFTGLRFNAATGSSAGSAAASLLMDLQLEGTSKYAFRKDGQLTINYPVSGTGVRVVGNGNGFVSSSSGTDATGYSGYGVRLQSSNTIEWSNSSNGLTGGLAILSRRGDANIRFGAADAAAPVAQTLSVQSGTAGASALSCSISGTTLTVGGAVTGTIAIGHAVTGTGVSAGTVITAGSGTTWTVNNSQTVSSTTMYFNSVGQNLTITGSQGSGPSAGGSIVFQVAPAGSAGTTAQNALQNALLIDHEGQATFTVKNTSGSPTLQIAKSGSASIQLIASTSFNIAVTASNLSLTANNGASPIYANGSYFNIGSSANDDTRLYRDTTNTLALRNGANAQTFRIYNTTDGTNSEFFGIIWSSNRAILTTATAGTGVTNRDLYLQNDQASQNVFCAAPFKFSLDNTYDIGASGGSRPRNVYVAGAVAAGGLVSTNSDFRAGSANFFYWNSRSQMSSPADGLILLQNIAASDFGRLQFGGTTSSFPALKRSSTTLQARLADDSAFASVQGKLTTDTAYAAGDPTTTGYLVVYDSTGTAYKIPAVAV